MFSLDDKALKTKSFGVLVKCNGFCLQSFGVLLDDKALKTKSLMFLLDDKELKAKSFGVLIKYLPYTDANF